MGFRSCTAPSTSEDPERPGPTYPGVLTGPLGDTGSRGGAFELEGALDDPQLHDCDGPPAPLGPATPAGRRRGAGHGTAP